MALTTATHAGLASTLSALVGAGLPADWLAEHQRALTAVTLEEVQEAARKYMAPSALTGVVVGDAAEVAEALRALGAVEVTGTGDGAAPAAPDAEAAAAGGGTAQE